MLNSHFIFGYTENKLPISAYKFGHTGAKILVLGGVHGDEIEGIQGALGLLAHFKKSFSYKLDLTIVPCLNLDGMLAKHRKNARGVDLNRNLPTEDWLASYEKESYYPGVSACSESENQALVEYIGAFKPNFILSLHSWKPMLNTNGDCKQIAKIISSHTGYIITDDIGYPTPGSLGTYCGIERSIPTLTYEIERTLPAKNIIDIHVPAILEGLKSYE